MMRRRDLPRAEEESRQRRSCRGPEGRTARRLAWQEQEMKSEVMGHSL